MRRLEDTEFRCDKSSNLDKEERISVENLSNTRRLHKIIYVNVNKSMGAPKVYLHVQRKLYYMEGQLGT